ncbi:hypothetical protein CGMCC3_g6348 [Colletotrichum fructicola]|nr:uncharacterized protein CGMCC3_g6348 [Colletotrichum fructicola]KAE9577749.1 hypothetical protein CGMCC3_g6348 [Colletotrichum fructicola]
MTGKQQVDLPGDLLRISSKRHSPQRTVDLGLPSPGQASTRRIIMTLMKEGALSLPRI